MKNPFKTQRETKEREVLTTLELLLSRDEETLKIVEKAIDAGNKAKDERLAERRAARYIISHFSNRSALSGCGTGLVGLIPLMGPFLAIFGGSTADAIFALKYEIEMSLALSALLGYDITQPRERKLAMLLACASIEDAFHDESRPSLRYVIELAMTEYSTRAFSKSLLRLISKALLSLGSKSVQKAFPFIGMALSASVNKMLTQHTGWQCYDALVERRRREATRNATA